MKMHILFHSLTCCHFRKLHQNASTDLSYSLNNMRNQYNNPFCSRNSILHRHNHIQYLTASLTSTCSNKTMWPHKTIFTLETPCLQNFLLKRGYVYHNESCIKNNYHHQRKMT